MDKSAKLSTIARGLALGGAGVAAGILTEKHRQKERRKLWGRKGAEKRRLIKAAEEASREVHLDKSLIRAIGNNGISPKTLAAYIKSKAYVTTKNGVKEYDSTSH